jgi:VIT1/CCC1 family predicted Fe2+/Mn2+ transporter
MTLGTGFVDRYLSPGDSLSEILFGLIMTLTFTLGAGILVRENPDAARELLIATVGCNVAWGIIDGLMYLAGERFERGRRARIADVIRGEASEEAAARILATELDEFLGRVTEESDRAFLYRKIARSIRSSEPAQARFTREDVYGAVASFWLVFFSSIPAALPYVFLDEAWVALRLSNAILIGLLFGIGYRWARHTNLPPKRVGFALMVGGLAMVLVAIALGG